MALREEVRTVTDHGGSLGAARALFPDAPEPWIDLSTGINPHAYPQLDLPAEAFTRLPEPQRVADLCRIAAAAYGAPAADNVVAAPGTQILLPLVAALRAPGKARILGPTYAEHIAAARLAGHESRYVEDFDALSDADLAVVVNPNNPDGRVCGRGDLAALARHLSEKGGLLVVDEAFMDVGPRQHSLAGGVEAVQAVVLRSFGKFFGLAGLRLGFALAPRAETARLARQLGPWAVAGPALEYGLRALADLRWQDGMRVKLAEEAAALDRRLLEAGLEIVGGTPLFRLVRHAEAVLPFGVLGRAGIAVRRFAERPDILRFGLPRDGAELERVAAALQSWKKSFARPQEAGRMTAP